MTFLKSSLNNSIKAAQYEINDYFKQRMLRQQQGQGTASLLNIVNNIPKDPNEFYKDFGFLTHPRTGKPVEYLTYYQKEFWKDIDRYRYALAIKSNKIG